MTIGDNQWSTHMSHLCTILQSGKCHQICGYSKYYNIHGIWISIVHLCINSRKNCHTSIFNHLNFHVMHLKIFVNSTARIPPEIQI